MMRVLTSWSTVAVVLWSINVVYGGYSGCGGRACYERGNYWPGTPNRWNYQDQGRRWRGPAREYMPPCINDMIRCIKRSQDYHYAYEPGSGNGDGDLSPPNCTTYDVLGAPGSGPSAGATITTTLASQDGSSTFEVRLPCSNPNGCNAQSTMCFQIGSSIGSGNRTATPMAAFSLTPRTTCTSTANVCSGPGPCHGSGIQQDLGHNRDTEQAADCPASATEVCTWTVTLCIQPTPSP